MAVATAALLEGARRFDPAKSQHFAAYARRCIHRDLVTYVRRHGTSIRLPREPRKGESERGRKSFKALQHVALDRSAPTDRAAFVVESPEDGILDGIDADRLVTLVNDLPEREATVVRMRFGLAGMAPHDLAEIGAVMSVSKQRVQALLDRALASLKDAMLKPRAAA
jgi:RNA polymerase sigma factor (sigma-70 family)